MSANMTCHGCGNPKAKYYDGAMGYEAIRCGKCKTEFDLNSDNSSPLPEELVRVYE